MNIQIKTAARENMLKSQILTGHVLDERILAALMAVSREDFVPSIFRGTAYVDQEIPLGGGRFLMEPLDFARLLKYAAIAGHETVLVVGTATGYSAAIIAHLAQKVVALEEDAGLAAQAKSLLGALPNVTFRQGALASGASGTAPYDVIILEGAIEYLPQTLSDQLAEGGRLLTAEHDAQAVVGNAGLSKLAEYRKVRGKLYKTTLRDANMALLPAFRKPEAFTF